MPTDKQKAVLLLMLNGGTIAYRGNSYGVRDASGILLQKISEKQFSKLKTYLRIDKKRGWVINLKTVRSLHGKTFLKTQYKKRKNGKGS